MKKGYLINSEISYVISKMGHTDMMVVCDSGLPIPKNVNRIDLALRKGTPSFLETLDTILSELKVEEVIIANEMKIVSADLYNEVSNRFHDVKITLVSHEEFKEMTKECLAVVRTGEFTPYANIILKSGVVF
ncbi:D-ribose pyranase [Alkalithermobacter thermoalcaliphilus JW-YL-7 = DSM 7308]|uniref:D-ribose pyranase n=1 Tax=Alkalithermobacter thermoalcaliphilus JW-YL-7 = DSM 7308 TaxID=1121328 RepID=A0A150FQ31_CLOPD|nr:D-ribose pyranase [[Clostridium] paradoxum JW-YL-7 = DSM 7308]SHK63567.1 D-ribose pyranase [[Clostridium] paradoxum JW-YL-7 = DSM 7308]